jgi:hypothetical protein
VHQHGSGRLTLRNSTGGRAPYTCRMKILIVEDQVSFGSFLYGEAVLVGWAFALGALFGWLADRMGMLASDFPNA